MTQKNIHANILCIPSTPTTIQITPLQTSYFSVLDSSIRNSSQSIQLCQYVFSASGARKWQRSEKIFQSLCDAQKRGVPVWLLMDRPKPRSPNAIANIKTCKRLQDSGIETKCLTIRTTLHLKIIIIDNQLLFTGSHNLTNASLYSPLELSFMTNDFQLVHSAVIFFASLWLAGFSEQFRPSRGNEKSIRGPT